MPVSSDRRTVFCGIVVLAALICLLSPRCSGTDPVSDNSAVRYAGMRHISASQNTARLGSECSVANSDEKPVSFSTFTYDYSIDTTEITIGQYEEIMGKKPAEYDTALSSPDQPVCHVSWFDAVLFCNERSKRDNLDTVYSYLMLEKTASGDVYGMVGLRTEFDRNGYRLPTESEWIFAARGSASDEYVWGDSADRERAGRYAWYNGNAGSSLHPVAQLSPNVNGLYDMAGNAAEWVTDRKITFNGGRVENFAGGIDDGATVKVLKGGSYKTDLENLRVSYRSDFYPVNACSRNYYTGFRCVAGVIRHPTLLPAVNAKQGTAPVRLLDASPPLSGDGSGGKLVFVNATGIETHTLCFIDYSATSPTCFEFTDTRTVYTPSISPDGGWVAWGTRDEGSFGEGAVFVRRLAAETTDIIGIPDTPAFVPRWFVDPATSDTFVVYVASAQLNDQATWNTTQTKMAKFEGGAFIGAPVIVESEGAYHGGLSADGGFLATGYPRLKMASLADGMKKTLFCAPDNGKRADDTSQVCNVSMSPGADDDPRVLFLDFGSGRDTSTLTNTVYRSHEYIFMAGFSGMVYNMYRVPEPFSSWNYVEWSNREGYAVATAVTSAGAGRLIYGIDLRTGAYTAFCEGSDLMHPYLWLPGDVEDDGATAGSDSAGRYDEPHLSTPQAEAAYKMKLLWRNVDSAAVVILGSSVADEGVDPRCFTGRKTVNLAIGGNDGALTLDMLGNYVLPHYTKLKAVILSYDLHTFFVKGGIATAFNTFSQSRGYRYDRSHEFWSDGVPESFSTMVDKVPIHSVDAAEVLKAVDESGMQRRSCSGWGPTPPTCNLLYLDVKLDECPYGDNFRMFLDCLRRCREAGVKVLLVNFPFHPGYAATEAYGPYGPRHDVAGTMLSDIRTAAEADPNLTFYDANNGGNHDYSSDEFCDAMHLCEKGAKKLSERLNTILGGILQ